jgi:hypothetical protein
MTTVTLDSVSSGYQNYGGTLSISHTVSGTQRVLVATCGIGGTPNNKVSGVTYGGIAMSLVRSEAGNGPSAVTYIYELVNPPVGTANVVWTFTSSDVTAQGFNASFNGVDQTTPVSASAGHNNSFASSPLGDSLTLPTGGMVMDVVAAGVPSSDGPLTPGANQTQIGTPNTQGLIITAASYSSTSGAMSWTWTGGAQRAGSHSMLALNPASGSTAAALAGNATAQATATGTLAGTAAGAALAGSATAQATSTGALANTASFVCDVMINNTNTVYKNQAVVWTWEQGGRVGSPPTSVVRGTGTINASGVLTLTGLPAGPGLGWVAVQHTNAADDDVFYQAGTAA